MKKNHIIIIAIVFLILFGALAFLSTSPRDSDATNAIIHNATLNVSSEGPIELSKILEDIGLIENMSYYVCPHCGEKTNIFGESQGEKFANDMGVVYLGNLPLTEQVPESANQDSTMVNSYADSEVSQKFSEIIDNIKLAFLDDD